MRVAIAVVLALIVIQISVASALTVYEFEIEDKKVEYGESVFIKLTYIGDGALKIVDQDDKTAVIFALTNGGQYTYEIKTEGLLYPSKYYVLVLDEQGNEMENETLEVYSTHAVVVIDIGEGKKAESYLYDILVLPTSLKPGNTTLDVYFSSNTYSKGGADIYFDIPEGWKSSGIHLPEVNFKNNVQIDLSVPESAFGTYILQLHIDTTFGKFNKSIVFEVEESEKEENPSETPTTTPEPTETPTITPTSTPIQYYPPTPTPTPTSTTISENISTTETEKPIEPEKTLTTDREGYVSIPGFEFILAMVSIAVAIRLIRK